MTGDHPSVAREGGGHIWWRGVHCWPFLSGVNNPAIPPGIQVTFDEACRAIAANCPRAGAVMARRTLEAIAADRGESNGTLVKRLEALTRNGQLPQTFAEWAKKIRLVGNVGAHFDLQKDVSGKDAEQLKDFIAELLNHLYTIRH